jgi:hypothetical protein
MHESLRVALILECCPCKRIDTFGISSMFSNMSALAVLLYAFVGCDVHFARLASVGSTWSPRSVVVRTQLRFFRIAAALEIRLNLWRPEFGGALTSRRGKCRTRERWRTDLYLAPIRTPPNLMMGGQPGSKTTVCLIEFFIAHKRKQHPTATVDHMRGDQWVEFWFLYFYQRLWRSYNWRMPQQTGRGALSGSDQLISGGMPLSRAVAHAVFVCTN